MTGDAIDVLDLFHDISVAFSSSTNFRTLIEPLARALDHHLPVVEIEIAELSLNRDGVWIRAFDPSTGDRWKGRRSSRFIERQEITEAEFTDNSVTISRIGSGEVATQLQLPLGARGLMIVRFGSGSNVLKSDAKLRQCLLESIRAKARDLTWLAETAERSRQAHRRGNRNTIVDDQAVIEPDTVESEQPSEPISITDISVLNPDIPVPTLEEAISASITTALARTRGKIYGEGGAAALLGLKPSTLQSKMRKLGIDRRAFVAN